MKKVDELRIRGKSNRRYQERNCNNPACGLLFIPTDFRHKYCCDQCRIDAGNDKRREQLNTRFIDQKRLHEYELILELLYERTKKLKIETVTRRELLLSGMDKECIHVEDGFLQKVPLGESKKIRWFYFFGLQSINETGTEYKVHKRTKID